MFEIVKTKKYTKSLDTIERISVLINLKKAISRLEEGPPFESYWNVHGLHGIYDTYQSINITGDWRLIFKRDLKKQEIVLYDIGTHSELYG